MSNTDYLNKYGNTFQLKVIANLLKSNTVVEGNNFISQVLDVLSPDYFESDANKFIIKIIIEYYKKYSKPPTAQVFKVELTKIDDILKQTVKDNIKQSLILSETCTDLEYIRDEFIKFCQNQKMKQAIMTSVDYIQEGKYEEIKRVIDDALTFGTFRDMGHVYEEMTQDRLVKQPRKKLMPTEWSVINEITDGGIGAGDLGILVGAAGGSKSWFLVSLGYHALLMGKNVLHFTMELPEKYVALRYDSKLTGIPSQNLKYHASEVEEKILSNIKGKLRVKYYPTKAASVITLKTFINKLLSYGFKPDLILVDYADLLRSDNPMSVKGGSYAEYGGIYEDLRGLAGEFQLPTWTVSQSNRSSGQNDIITGEQIAESYKKVMTGDVVLSVSRKTQDKIANTARFYIIKNRYGIDGLTFPAKIDASIGKIDIFAANTTEGLSIQRDMDNAGELVRKELASKYKDFKKENTPSISDGFE